MHCGIHNSKRDQTVLIFWDRLTFIKLKIHLLQWMNSYYIYNKLPHFSSITCDIYCTTQETNQTCAVDVNTHISHSQSLKYECAFVNVQVVLYKITFIIHRTQWSEKWSCRFLRISNETWQLPKHMKGVFCFCHFVQNGKESE